MFPIGFTYDNELLLEDGAGTITTPAAGSIAQIDVGEGLFIGCVVVDVSAMDTGTGDEVYSLEVQGSTVSGMATEKVQLAAKTLGDATQLAADADAGVGRHVIPFVNIDENGELQRYVRLYFNNSGTTPIITCVAFISTFPSS